MLESNAYKTYYASSREKTPKLKYVRNKADPDTSPKQKPVQATKGTRLKSKAKMSKSDKKKQPAKKPKAKGLVVLSEVALTETEQLKLATKRSKKDFHISHASGSGVPDVPTYKYESEKEYWGDSDEEDDNEDDFDDDSDDNDESDDERTEYDRDEIPDPNKTNVEHNEEEEEYDDEFNIEEEEKIADEELMDEEEDDEVTKDMYDDVNVNLGNEDTDMTNANQGASEQQNSGGPKQSSSVSFDFTSKLLNLDNPSPVDIEIASLMDTTAQHATTILEIASSFTTIVPPPLPFFNPLQQEVKLTLTPTASKTTTSLPTLPNLASVFKFNERVFNLEKDVSEIKQVYQYAQALSSIPAIVDHYMDNKLGEAINKAILAHNLDCRQEAQDEKNAYIELVDTSMRALIKEEVNTQLPQILPQAVSDFANPKIEKNVIESVKVVVLTRSSSQPTSTYKAAASLSEFELRKILIDKMEKNKSYDKADYKKKLYDALVESYNTNKDQDPSAGSDQGKKRRKSSKDDESSRDLRSKEKKSSSTFKDASQSQHKSSGKSAYAEEPSHTVKDSGMQQDQEFVTGDNDEQPADKEVTKADWFKKPERPPTPDPDWSKRQHVDFRPPQTWISQVARAEEPPTSFDELNDTSFDFSAFVMNRLKIPNLTQEILVGPAFNLLKGTCKSITKLEYHLEECSKATTERLDWHNPKNKPYPFDLRKPLPLIQDHRGRQIIPQDYFINKDLEYLKGGDLSRRYSTSVTKTKAATYDLKWIKDLVNNLWSPVQVKYDQHAYLGTSHWGPKRQRFYGYASNLTSSKDVYSRRRIIAVTRLKIMKMYDYGHLEEIEVRRDDQKLYTFKEGDFKRLRLQDIEDMLLLLIQQKLTNLTIDEWSNLRKRTAYTAYSDPKGVIYKDQMNRNRLMHADELHKFSDGTLDDVRSALNDIAKGIRMEYLPMRKWSNLDKKRARVMNRRDLPRDIPLDSVVVLRYEKRSKSDNKGKVPTEMELVLEQTHKGTSYEVSVSAERVEELKRKVKIKGEKKEALRTLRQKPGQYICCQESQRSLLTLKTDIMDSNIKKDDYTRFQHQEQYEHVGPEVTRLQEGKSLQDDDKRLCLIEDLKEVLNHIHIKSKIQVKA
ncbi:hypothetical protein Tco_0152493 [Tanacetum coccineum]